MLVGDDRHGYIAVATCEALPLGARFEIERLNQFMRKTPSLFEVKQVRSSAGDATDYVVNILCELHT
jgi:hypothetical protein